MVYALPYFCAINIRDYLLDLQYILIFIAITLRVMMKSIKKLNIGCGTKKLEGYINCDIDPAVNPDKVCSIEKLSFPDNSIDEVHLSAILEHVDLFKAIKEVNRVCKDGAIVEIWMPHWSNFSTWTHLEHKRGGSYFMFDKDKMHQYEFDFAVVEKKLQFFGYKYDKNENNFLKKMNPIKRHVLLFFDWLCNKYPHSFERLWCYWVGGAEGVYFKLKVVKHPKLAKGKRKRARKSRK